VRTGAAGAPVLSLTGAPLRHFHGFAQVIGGSATALKDSSVVERLALG
jgi:hypothetical protein